MTNTFKRRIYRLSLFSTTSFLAAVLLYVLADIGIATSQLYLLFAFVLLVGVISSLKTLEVWSSWNEDTSVDADTPPGRNTYPITFYTEAAILALLAAFLLFSIRFGEQSNGQDSLIFTFSLFVIGGCVLIGRLSSGLQ